MKINNKQHILAAKFKHTGEDISEETMRDFPDLNTGHPFYNKPACGSTIGYEMPVNDEVYIGKRSKELETELTAIPQKMKKLQKVNNVAGATYIAGILGFGASMVGGLLAASGSCSGAVVMKVLLTSMGALLTGAVIGSTSDTAMHKNWLQYYDDRTELDHIRRGELWKPSPSYVAPDPEADAGVPHSPVEKDGVVYY